MSLPKVLTTFWSTTSIDNIWVYQKYWQHLGLPKVLTTFESTKNIETSGSIRSFDIWVYPKYLQDLPKSTQCIDIIWVYPKYWKNVGLPQRSFGDNDDKLDLTPSIFWLAISRTRVRIFLLEMTKKWLISVFISRVGEALIIAVFINWCLKHLKFWDKTILSLLPWNTLFKQCKTLFYRQKKESISSKRIRSTMDRWNNSFHIDHNQAVFKWPLCCYMIYFLERNLIN